MREVEDTLDNGKGLSQAEFRSARVAGSLAIFLKTRDQVFNGVDMGEVNWRFFEGTK
jgi:hypothetical protein